MRGMKTDHLKAHPNNGKGKKKQKNISNKKICKKNRKSATISLAPGYIITPGRKNFSFPSLPHFLCVISKRQRSNS
jgi:hypothetical protein